MAAKKLIVMAVVLVLLAVIALLQRQSVEKHLLRQKENGATLFHRTELNGIDRLEITKGSNSVYLAKQNGGWVVESLFDYPVDFGKLTDALRTAAEVKLGSPVRSSNVDLSEYGMEDVKVIALQSEDRDTARLEIGAQREASNSTGWANQYFVRKGSTENIYLVDYNFRPFSEDADEWIDTELLNISSSDIVAVQVGSVELKVDGTEWKLAALDEEFEELQSSEADKLRGALQYLHCETIADPAKSDAELGFTNTVVYTAQTTNRTYTVTVGGEIELGRYIRLGGDVPEELNGWTYVVSTYKASDFLISRDELVKEKEALSEEYSSNSKKIENDLDNWTNGATTDENRDGNSYIISE